MIKLNNVSFSYGKKEILKDIDLCFDKGLTVIAGPNGSGKSTLMRIMAGLLRGECLLDGDRADKLPPMKRAKILAYVSQKGYFSSDITVEEAVLLGRYCHVGMLSSYSQTDRQAVKNAMLQCEVDGIARQSVLSLSGGELQRVLLARALAQLDGEGKYLLLDEPITALDMRHQLRFMQIAKEISKQKCVVAVLHDIAMAANFADRITVLSQGRLYADGDPDDVLTSAALSDVWGLNGSVKMGDNGYYLDIIA